MTDVFLELDPRRRVTLKVGHHDRYLAHEEPDGTIVLRPAVVLTTDDLALRSNPDLMDRITRAMSDPAEWTKGPRRSVKE
jgi:hypothetical protein